MDAKYHLVMMLLVGHANNPGCNQNQKESKLKRKVERSLVKLVAHYKSKISKANMV